MCKRDVIQIYLTVKDKEYKKLTEKEKEFLKELQYQIDIMRDFCKALKESEIVSLIRRCENEIQLEIALRNLKNTI